MRITLSCEITPKTVSAVSMIIGVVLLIIAGIGSKYRKTYASALFTAGTIAAIQSIPLYLYFRNRERNTGIESPPPPYIHSRHSKESPLGYHFQQEESPEAEPQPEPKPLPIPVPEPEAAPQQIPEPKPLPVQVPEPKPLPIPVPESEAAPQQIPEPKPLPVQVAEPEPEIIELSAPLPQIIPSVFRPCPPISEAQRTLLDRLEYKSFRQVLSWEIIQKINYFHSELFGIGHVLPKYDIEDLEPKIDNEILQWILDKAKWELAKRGIDLSTMKPLKTLSFPETNRIEDYYAFSAQIDMHARWSIQIIDIIDQDIFQRPCNQDSHHETITSLTKEREKQIQNLEQSISTSPPLSLVLREYCDVYFKSLYNIIKISGYFLMYDRWPNYFFPPRPGDAGLGVTSDAFTFHSMLYEDLEKIRILKEKIKKEHILAIIPDLMIEDKEAFPPPHVETTEIIYTSFAFILQGDAHTLMNAMRTTYSFYTLSSVQNDKLIKKFQEMETHLETVQEKTNRFLKDRRAAESPEILVISNDED